MAKQLHWPKNIKVDKRIVKILSESTYENFPTALKEIITNSYDADSTEVIININESNEVITIEDNGKGMSEIEFDYYLTIAGMKREKNKGKTLAGRQIVGKFGVGFLSIFPYFNTFSIETKKSNSEQLLTANIPCYQYFTTESFVDVSQIPIQGQIKFDNKNFSKSFTKIRLSGFTALSKAFFHPGKQTQHRKDSIKSQSALKKIKWQLEEDLPLRYDKSEFDILIKNYSPNLPFSVYLNKTELLRPTFGKEILEINKVEKPFDRIYSDEELEVNNNVVEIGKIKFHYFILTDKVAIHPFQARGLKRRNLNVGVGERTAFGLDSEIRGGRSRLQWLTGEVHIISGLNEIINVNRTDFYYDPDYEQLTEVIVKKLSRHSTLLENEAEYLREESNQQIKNLHYIEEEDEEESATPTLKVDKKIKLNGKNYKVKVNKWKFEGELYPACKIKGDTIIINKSYPLFSGKKFTDVFIKFHLLLLNSLKEEIIDENGLRALNENLLEIYQDYI